MARILITWEIGEGMGHLAQCRPVAAELARRGHEICIASSHAISVQRMMRGIAFTFISIPAWPAPIRRQSRVYTYAHILRDIGYANAGLLTHQLRTWLSIVESVDPKILIANASPTALLAARATGKRTVLLGTGFDSPTGTHPLTNMRFWEPTESSTLCMDEDAVLDSINRALQSLGKPVLTRLCELFRVDFTALYGVAELDHYRDREETKYYAPLPTLPGVEVPWPPGEGARVFAYLKPFPEIGKLLSELQRRELPTLVYAPELGRNIVERHASETIRFAEAAVDIDYAATRCDLGISNAGLLLALDLLLAGKPMLCFPLYLEQNIVARNIAAIGAGLYCSPWRTRRVGEMLGALIDSPTYATFARGFAAKYAHLDRAEQTSKLSDQIEARVV